MNIKSFMNEHTKKEKKGLLFCIRIYYYLLFGTKGSTKKQSVLKTQYYRKKHKEFKKWLKKESRFY